MTVVMKSAVPVFWRVVCANTVLTFAMLKIVALSVTRREPPNFTTLSKFKSRIFGAGYRMLLLGTIRRAGLSPVPVRAVVTVMVGLNGKLVWALKFADAEMSHGSRYSPDSLNTCLPLRVPSS